jgi:enamine deaminase RidA (YjgF/YER057c/UK114 family)
LTDQRLTDQHVTDPAPALDPEPVAAGDYSVARIAGNLVFTAGMTPRADGALIATGLVGAEVSESDARALTAVATERALRAAESVLSGSAQLVEAISLTVYVAADSGFTRLSYVADAASGVIGQRFPEADQPVRAAVGVASLPGGAPVEVQLIARFAGNLG